MKEETTFDLSDRTTEELVNLFNREVGNPGWVHARAIFLETLRNEFLARDIDVSAVCNESGGFQLSRTVTLRENRLIVV